MRGSSVSLRAVVLSAVVVVGCGDDDSSRTDAGGAGEGGMTEDASSCIGKDDECTGRDGDCCGELVCRMSSGGRAFCVGVDDTCFVGAQTGCCLDDADCPDPGRCHLAECRSDGDGVCKDAPPEGGCWSDLDCPAGARCTGASVCPCGAECLVEDMPGTCG